MIDSVCHYRKRKDVRGRERSTENTPSFHQSLNLKWQKFILAPIHTVVMNTFGDNRQSSLFL